MAAVSCSPQHWGSAVPVCSPAGFLLFYLLRKKPLFSILISWREKISLQGALSLRSGGEGKEADI